MAWLWLIFVEIVMLSVLLPRPNHVRSNESVLFRFYYSSTKVYIC